MSRFLGKLIITGAVVLVLLCSSQFWFDRFIYPINFETEVLKAEADHKLPRNLILSVIREESRFNKDSKSSVGAVGLMQILPSTAQWIAGQRGVKYDNNKLDDPAINIYYGAWYLRYLTNELKSDTLALEAYNAGIAKVLAWEKENPGVVPFIETEKFVKRVNESQKKYDQLYGEKWEKR